MYVSASPPSKAQPTPNALEVMHADDFGWSAGQNLASSGIIVYQATPFALAYHAERDLISSYQNFSAGDYSGGFWDLGSAGLNAAGLGRVNLGGLVSSSRAATVDDFANALRMDTAAANPSNAALGSLRSVDSTARLPGWSSAIDGRILADAKWPTTQTWNATTTAPTWTSDVGQADLDAYRAALKLPTTTQTLAVGKSDIPELQGLTWNGGSVKVYDLAGLPRPLDGALISPSSNPLFTRHAEGDVGNQFIDAVNAAGLSPQDLAGKNLNIIISNPTGVCTTCVAGLSNPLANPGVIKQLSNMYPELTINIKVATVPGITPATGSNIVVRGGKKVGP